MDSFLTLLGTEKSWKIIRSGLFVVKLLGNIYRLDKLSQSSDMDGSANKDGFGGSEMVVNVDEEVIYYDHLFEISHEIVCTLSVRLFQVLQGIITNLNVNEESAQSIFEALSNRLIASIANTFTVFDIVAHIIVSKCSFSGQTLKKYFSTMERCLLTILRGAEAVAMLMDTILSTRIPLIDSVRAFIREMSSIVLRVLRIGVRFTRISRDDGSITNEGNDFLSTVSSCIIIIAKIYKTVGDSEIISTAIGTLLSELQVKLVNILSLLADPVQAAFSDRLSIQLPQAAYPSNNRSRWVEKNDIIYPSEPRRRVYQYSFATPLAASLTVNFDNNGSESKMNDTYPSTPFGAAYSPFVQQGSVPTEDIPASDKLSSFLFFCRPLLNSILSLLSLELDSGTISEQRHDSFLPWMRSIIDLVLLLRSKLRSFYDFQYSNQVIIPRMVSTFQR